MVLMMELLVPMYRSSLSVVNGLKCGGMLATSSSDPGSGGTGGASSGVRLITCAMLRMLASDNALVLSTGNSGVCGVGSFHSYSLGEEPTWPLADVGVMVGDTGDAKPRTSMIVGFIPLVGGFGFEGGRGGIEQLRTGPMSTLRKYVVKYDGSIAVGFVLINRCSKMPMYKLSRRA